MKALGVVLIVLGLVGICYGGFSWTQQKKVIDAGPIQVTHDSTKSVPIPPVAGAVCLVAGAIVLAGRSRRAA